MKFWSQFSKKNPLDFHKNKQKIMNFYNISQNVMKFHKISWYSMV